MGVMGIVGGMPTAGRDGVLRIREQTDDPGISLSQIPLAQLRHHVTELFPVGFPKGFRLKIKPQRLHRMVTLHWL